MPFTINDTLFIIHIGKFMQDLYNNKVQYATMLSHDHMIHMCFVYVSCEIQWKYL